MLIGYHETISVPGCKTYFQNHQKYFPITQDPQQTTTTFTYPDIRLLDHKTKKNIKHQGVRNLEQIIIKSKYQPQILSLLLLQKYLNNSY